MGSRASSLASRHDHEMLAVIRLAVGRFRIMGRWRNLRVFPILAG
jgi:hypothetical protein